MTKIWYQHIIAWSMAKGTYDCGYCGYVNVFKYMTHEYSDNIHVPKNPNDKISLSILVNYVCVLVIMNIHIYYNDECILMARIHISLFHATIYCCSWVTAARERQNLCKDFTNGHHQASNLRLHNLGSPRLYTMTSSRYILKRKARTFVIYGSNQYYSHYLRQYN